MTIAFFEPLSRAWNRMKNALFTPFDLNTWLSLGFTAFLADLLNSHGGGNSSHKGGHFDFEDIIDAPRRLWEWLGQHPGWFLLIIFGAIFLLLFLLLLLWLSSRGKFMFLDNVIQSRALVSQPWREFKELANSLFVWRLVFTLVSLFFVLFFVSSVWHTAADLYFNEYRIPVMFLASRVFFLVLLILVIAYVGLLLDHFVVPVMYKHRISATQAWQKFLTIHWHSFGYFVLYAFLMLLLYLFVAIAVVTFGLFTCCMGFLLLIIPYVNSVVLLPISYTFRAFGPEFLGQFGEDFKIFSE